MMRRIVMRRRIHPRAVNLGRMMMLDDLLPHMKIRNLTRATRFSKYSHVLARLYILMTTSKIKAKMYEG